MHALRTFATCHPKAKHHGKEVNKQKKKKKRKREKEKETRGKEKIKKKEKPTGKQ